MEKLTGVLGILDPDEFELRVAGTQGMIPKCPFCGRWPTIYTTYNEATGIFGARVICSGISGCHATMLYNARDREAARTGAIENWSKRYEAGA